MGELRFREATPSDFGDVLRLLPLLRTGDPLPDEATWQERLRPGSVVLEEDGRVVAVAWARTIGAWAHVVHVIVDEALQGRGLGRRLMEGLAACLRAAGCSRWYLNVKRDNEPALRLYRALGFGTPVETEALEVPVTAIGTLPAPEGALAARIAAGEEDESIEATWELPHGIVADARARGELPIALGARSEAFAIFHPPFGGAWLFRVAAPAWARPLLEACRAHLPAPREMLLVVAEDPGVAALLRAHGARLRFALYRLAGTIPPGSR